MWDSKKEARLKKLENMHVTCNASGELILRANAVQIPYIQEWQIPSPNMPFRIEFDQPIRYFLYFKKELAPKCDYIVMPAFGDYRYMQHQNDTRVNKDGTPYKESTQVAPFHARGRKSKKK